MTDTELSALVRLYDDESAVVRDAVLMKLASYGADLERRLRDLPAPPPPDELRAILGVLELHRDETAHRAREARRAGRARFGVGSLVRHKRYGYRGVVVAFDETCQADDDWYTSHRTQPDRAQPWYHVLVDGSDQVTYAAQSSLDPDASTEDVEHPLVPYFFRELGDGTYERNDRPWPDW